jgi:DNA polymerase elongation subunit (family B)
MITIYDLETYKEIFVAVFKDLDGNIYKFEISRRKNELKSLISFCNQCKGMIGYNNLSFDYPILHMILTNKQIHKVSGKKLASMLYKKANEIISSEYTRVKNPLILQADLYLIWHFNNKAKATSLKKCQFFFNWELVQDLPYQPHEDLTHQMMDEIIEYCINDVNSTEHLYNHSQHKFKLRIILGQLYNSNFTNFNDVKIGEFILLKTYCNKLGIDLQDIKYKQTRRNLVNLSDCIPSYVDFKSKEFNNLVDIFKQQQVNPYDSEFHYSVEYKGFQYDYGLCGIHGSINGVFEEDDEWEIYDWDVASLYPSLMINLNIFPEHLGIEFLNVYKEILDKRLKSKKLRKDKSLSDSEITMHNAINDGLKLSLNGSYGFVIKIKLKNGNWNILYN